VKLHRSVRLAGEWPVWAEHSDVVIFSYASNACLLGPRKDCRS